MGIVNAVVERKNADGSVEQVSTQVLAQSVARTAVLRAMAANFMKAEVAGLPDEPGDFVEAVIMTAHEGVGSMVPVEELITAATVLFKALIDCALDFNNGEVTAAYGLSVVKTWMEADEAIQFRVREEKAL